MNLHRIFSTSAVAVVAVLLSVGVQTLAYTAPSAAPTGGDADAPLNVGSAAQTKSGNLSVQGTLSSGGAATLGSSVSSSAIGALVGGQLVLQSGNLRLLDQSGLGSAIISTKYCFGTSSITATPTNCITAWPTGAGGTVTSVSQGAGVTLTPNPITTTGTITADTAYLQRRVSGTCTVGSSITAVAADGTVTCSKKMQTGTRTGLGAVTGLSMPDTTYVVALDPNGGTTDCRAAYATSKSTTGFSIAAGDACTSVVYNWIAIDY